MHRQRNFVLTGILSFLVFFSIDLCLKAYSQRINVKEKKQEESYSRPEPSRPIKPEIPSANRYQQDKIFLEYADSLYKRRTNDTIEKQILKGSVKFRQAGMWMYCDSAYYYPQLNSLDAFSNVRMEQGDTLFVYADKLFYEGNIRLAKLKNGPTNNKVKLINKDVTLTTDSLDYDLSIDLGWYSKWGTIDDKVNTLTSLYGEYSPKTKEAEFFHDVVLVNNKDGYTLLTDTLYYNTETHIANIESLTEIQSESDTIITRKAVYDTDLGNAELLTRSTIIHRDSTGNIITIEGDSIIYDQQTHISRAYMFRDPLKRSTPVILTDTAQKMTLIGGFGIYNDSTREALSTMYPLLMEYSQGDTLFLRADTIKTYIVREMVPAKRRYTQSGYPEKNGIPIVKIDTLGMWIDTVFFSVSAPMQELPLDLLIKALPVKEPVEINKEIVGTPKPKEVLNNQPVIENPNNTHAELKLSNDNTKSDSLDQFENSIIEEIIDFPDSVTAALSNDPIYQERDIILEADSIDITNGLNTIPVGEIDSLAQKAFTSDEFNRRGEVTTDSLLTEISENIKDSIPMEPREYHVALAYYRARFFKKDMQGVADSMVFIEKDSIMYLFRKPIVWSGERQVTGNRIDVHFNDSTVDWARLPESGMISEYIDEDFYNQIAGKEILAEFENEELKKLSVSGNVETIFLPQESDSTYNRLVTAESSFLELDLENNKMDRLKMWPEVNGTVTPIFLVKKSQQYLQKFRWWSSLRPKKDRYENGLKWDDELGEVPEDLEKYFLAPSDFGEPKTFSASRFVAPPSSLYVWDEMTAQEVKDSTIVDSLKVDLPDGDFPASDADSQTLIIPDSSSFEEINEEAIDAEEEIKKIDEIISDENPVEEIDLIGNKEEGEEENMQESGSEDIESGTEGEERGESKELKGIEEESSL